MFNNCFIIHLKYLLALNILSLFSSFFLCFAWFYRVEAKYFKRCPPITMAGEKGSKLVFFKEKSLNVFSTSSGKPLHSFSSIKPVGNAGQNSLLSSWGDVVLCNSSEDENSLKILDTKDFKVLLSFRVFEEKDEEEFLHLTQIIMKSENEVLVAKKMKIGLYSVDKGEILRTYKCKIDDWIQNASVDLTCSTLVFPKRDKVAKLDLETGERTDVLPHPNYVSRSFAVDCDMILTSGGDNVVRVWDLTREDVQRHFNKPEVLTNIYSIPGDSRHLVTVGRLGIDNFCVTIWDLTTLLPVRKITGITTSYIQPINDRRVALRVDERVAIVDLLTWKVVTVLKGKIPAYDFLGVDDICVVNNREEILTFAHDRKSLILYNIETGDQVAVLKTSKSELEIPHFFVNPEGTVAVWDVDSLSHQLSVWNLETREEIFVIDREGSEKHTEFTPDGRYFMFSARKKSDYVVRTAVWDIQASKYTTKARQVRLKGAFHLSELLHCRASQ